MRPAPQKLCRLVDPLPPQRREQLDFAAAGLSQAPGVGHGGAAVGCGAIVLEREYGELKRMFTRPTHRGRGIAGAPRRQTTSRAPIRSS